MLPSKINLRATALRKKEQGPLTRVSLEYAQLIAHRRACRVAENRSMEQNNYHFHNLQNPSELENQFDERQRMETHLRRGNVPAHMAHPIAAAMLAPAAPVAMVVDDADTGMGVVETVIAKNDSGRTYQTATCETDRNRDVPNLDDFTSEENKLIRRQPDAPGVAPYVPIPEVVRTLNIKIRARNAQYTRHTGQP